MLLDFTKFSKNVKLRPSDVTIDNFVFKLHYRVTFWFLLTCILLISSRQFIKEHIQCLTSDEKLKDVINTFCFFSTTFTVSRLHNISYLAGVHVVSPGVGPARAGDERRYHAYYQWVPFVLAFQAVLFYLPHYLWKAYEKKRMKVIASHLNTLPYTADTDSVVEGYNIDSAQTRQGKEKMLKQMYLTRSMMKLNRGWATSFLICESLNLVNLILQIKMIDLFLKGNFFYLGIQWMIIGDEVLESVFPKVTKCTFHKFGVSGTIQNHDAVCLMSLNIINEKLYLLIWFWFLLLLVVTSAGLFWRFLNITLHSNILFNRFVWCEMSPGVSLKEAEMKMIASKLSFPDWLFLRYIGKNLDPRMFRTVVNDVCQTLSPNFPMAFSSKNQSESIL